jgi:Ser/Thr protein kinase RdoA (MazF antagonist)
VGVPQDVLRAWLLHPGDASSRRVGSGHIHETWRVDPAAGESTPALLLQRLNEHVFPDPDALTETIGRVTAHLRAKATQRGETDTGRRVLTPVHTRAGEPSLSAQGGGVWRAFLFVPGARTHRVTADPVVAFHAARAFGAFQRDLDDLPPPRLAETIPGFHDTPLRLAALARAVEQDALSRARDAGPEIEAALAREPLAGVLLGAHAEGLVPERVTHNDTKLDNVLFDERTGEGLCVIDLDTVMPGLRLYDFGDLVRGCVSGVAEDERDTARIAARPDLFRALVAGYLEGIGPLLTPTETDLLAFAPRLIALELAVRFLTDHLEGDRYFRVEAPDQNLLRCRAQLALLRSLEDGARVFRRVVREVRVA